VPDGLRSQHLGVADGRGGPMVWRGAASAAGCSSQMHIPMITPARAPLAPVFDRRQGNALRGLGAWGLWLRLLDQAPISSTCAK